MKTRMELTCPGTAANYQVITATEWQSKYGIGHPSNVGDCSLFISPLGEDGVPLENGTLNVELRPGDSRHWYHPPPGTFQIVAVCSKTCHQKAILEYDEPMS